ncbi:MAG: hypothetical protein ACK58U_12060 [Rubrivivax sp.]
MAPGPNVQEARPQLACRNCGAALGYCATAQALRCAYCASVTPMPSPARDSHPAGAEAQGRPEAIVPLAVDEKSLLDALHEHLITGTLTPDDLLQAAVVVQKERFYVPVFEFSGSYEAQWTASFGYDRTEHYTVYENRTENGRTRQVPVTKTRVVTDWRPASGQDSGRFSVRAYAGHRLSEAGPPVLALAQDNSLGQAVPFSDAYLQATDHEACALTAEATYDERGRAQVNARIDEGVERHGQGDRQRDWHWTAQIRQQHRTVLVPVCHVAYDYQGQRYHCWSSGVDTSRWVADTLPVDKRRSWALAWGLAPLGIALMAAPMAMKSLSANGGDTALPAFTLLAAGAFAVWRYRCIVGQSMKRRQALLAARRGQQGAATASGPSRLTEVTSGRAAVVTGCILAALLPALPFMPEPSWRTASEAPAAAPAAPTSAAAAAAAVPSAPALTAQRLAARDKQQSSTVLTSPSAAAALVEPEPEPGAAQTPTEAVASILVAASVMDWPTVDAGLARMKARVPAHTPQEVDALNEKARTDLQRDDKDRAADTLTLVLAMKPESPSAWSNLTQALTNPDAARGALRVAIRLSTHREKTIEYLHRVQREMAGEPFARLAAHALKEVHQIPLHPKDPSLAATRP